MRVAAGSRLVASHRKLRGFAVALSLAVASSFASPLQARITLTWSDNSDNESGFCVERSDDDGNFSEIGRVRANQTAFLDPGARPGRKYAYRVRAFNRFGYSGYSNVSAKFIPNAAPKKVAPRAATAFTQHSGDGPKPSIIKAATFDSVTLTTNGDGYDRFADRLSFNYLPGNGDFRLVVRITDFNPDGPESRAGLMIRSDLSPNAAQASIVLNGNHEIEWLYREEDLGRTRIQTYRRRHEDPYFALEKVGRKLYLKHSEDGRRWKTLVGLYRAFEDDFLVGIALGSHESGNSSEAKFTIVESHNIDASLFGLPPLETPIPSKLIGEHSHEGDYRYEEDIGLHILEASGQGFGDTGDSIHYAFSETEQDALVTLRVRGIASKDPEAQASLMFRQSLNPDSAYAAVTVNRDMAVSSNWRTSDRRRTESVSPRDIDTAFFLRIEKNGSLCGFSASSDGFNWTTLTRRPIRLLPPYLVGFSIASSNNDDLASGGFEVLESNVPLLDPSLSDYGSNPDALQIGSRTRNRALYEFDPKSRIHMMDSRGSGFEDSGDQLTFPSWTSEGSCRIAAKLHEFAPDGPHARFGLMMRGSASTDAPFAAVVVNGNNQVEALWRAAQGHPISSRRSRALPEGSYLALEKTASGVAFLYSIDGARWTQLLERDLPLPRSFRVGPVIGSQTDYSIGALEITGLY